MSDNRGYVVRIGIAMGPPEWTSSVANGRRRRSGFGTRIKKPRDDTTTDGDLKLTWGVRKAKDGAGPQAGGPFFTDKGEKDSTAASHVGEGYDAGLLSRVFRGPA